MVIGRSGDGIDELKKNLVKLTGKTVDISIEEVRRAELDAQLTAESVAQTLERRVSFRRAMKQAMQRTMKANARVLRSFVQEDLVVQKSLEARSTQRVTFHYTQSELTSITDLLKQTQHMVRSVLRFGLTTAKS